MLKVLAYLDTLRLVNNFNLNIFINTCISPTMNLGRSEALLYQVMGPCMISIILLCSWTMSADISRSWPKIIACTVNSCIIT